MANRAPEPTEETIHQWSTLEEKRLEKRVSKKELSLSAGMQDSYYYQSHKFKRPIPLEVLATWSKLLDLPIGMLFLEGNENPKAKIIHLVQQADEEKLPQALRVLEALLAS